VSEKYVALTLDLCPPTGACPTRAAELSAGASPTRIVAPAAGTAPTRAVMSAAGVPARRFVALISRYRW
jgi:hypothetical protein